jgi:hypothetical protein
VAKADTALLVSDDDQRGEAEAAAALDDFGDAVDVDKLVDEFAVALFAIPIPIRPPRSRSPAIVCSVLSRGLSPDHPALVCAHSYRKIASHFCGIRA